MEHLALFALGAIFGPAVGRALRPVLRGAIRGGLVVGRQFRSARENLSEIADEARAEITVQETARAVTPRPAAPARKAVKAPARSRKVNGSGNPK